jgi:hypothetical protein
MVTSLKKSQALHIKIAAMLPGIITVFVQCFASPAGM